MHFNITKYILPAKTESNETQLKDDFQCHARFERIKDLTFKYRLFLSISRVQIVIETNTVIGQTRDCKELRTRCASSYYPFASISKMEARGTWAKKQSRN